MTNTFICFVPRDKEVAAQLIAPLEAEGMTVEPIKLRLGDRPVERIKEGFATAKSGALLLSPAFFRNPWPRSDLDELAAMAQPNEEAELAIIWSDIDSNLIASYSPALASITGYPADMVLDEAPLLMEQAPMNKGITFEQTAVMRGGSDGDLINRSHLSKMIMQYFSTSELRTLMFDLGIDYEDISGRGKSEKIRGLVLYMDRRGRLDELIQQISIARPFVDWRAVN